MRPPHPGIHECMHVMLHAARTLATIAPTHTHVPVCRDDFAALDAQLDPARSTIDWVGIHKRLSREIYTYVPTR